MPYPLIYIVTGLLLLAWCIIRKQFDFSGIACAIFIYFASVLVVEKLGFYLLVSTFIIMQVCDFICIKKRKQIYQNYFQIKEQKNALDVLSKYALTLVSCLLGYCTGSAFYKFVYLISLAIPFIDTVATKIGIISNTTYDIFHNKKVPAGTTGGISILGTTAALVAAIAFGFAAYYLTKTAMPCIICSFLAFGACFLDSLLGTYLQEKFIQIVEDEKPKTENTDNNDNNAELNNQENTTAAVTETQIVEEPIQKTIITEKNTCGEIKNEHYSGVIGIDNHSIKFITSFVICVLGYLLVFIFKF